MSPAITPLAANPPAIDTSATAFMIICAALVLLMTPGLALFYGGMTRAKSVLNMLMMSFASMAVVGVVWVLWGFSMSGSTGVAQLFGNPFEAFGLSGLVGTTDLIGAGFGATGGSSTLGTVGGEAAEAASTPTAAAAGAPDWAKRMKRSQRLSHGVQATAHAVRSGDSHGGASSVNLSEGNRS